VRAETAPLRARLSAQAARLRGALGARPANSAAVPEADDPGDTLRALHRFILREIDRALPLVEEREAAALLRDVRAAHARALAETEPAEGRG